MEHAKEGNRLCTLDYLRGLAAFGIMIYHYSLWIYGKYTAEDFMQRVGVYGVSIFYVLSGLTLFHVYYNKMTPTLADIGSFAKKRIFRIYPLLWLVLILTVILKIKASDPYTLFLNFTGLFGFVKWDSYAAMGIWSIGNELVFYVFFPLFILLTKKSKTLMGALCALLFILYLYFAFVKLTPDVSLKEQWRAYSNPLNQVFLFLSGFLIGLLFTKTDIKNTSVFAMLILGVGLFALYPASGDSIELVTGINRFIFTLSCCLICISFYKFRFKFPAFIHKPLALLGEASYSIYLLHPIVYFGLAKWIEPFPDSGRLIIPMFLTLFISYGVYKYFEKYFIRLGAKTDIKLFWNRINM